MQLRAWRKLKSLPRIRIAEAIGITEVTVLRHERGLRYPPPRTQEKYREFTEGAVTAQDWADLAKDPSLGADPEEVEAA